MPNVLNRLHTTEFAHRVLTVFVVPGLLKARGRNWSGLRGVGHPICHTVDLEVSSYKHIRTYAQEFSLTSLRLRIYVFLKNACRLLKTSMLHGF
jgi:hypothetical protein